MKTFTTNKNIVCRNIHGSYFLIDITDNYSDDNCRLFEINEIGFIIWNGLKTFKSNQIENITNDILSRLIDDINPQVIQKDVSDFISLLQKKNFIEED